MADTKTRQKSRENPFNGAPLVPGNPGNSGGKKGRSGRKPQDFVAWCKSITDDEIVRGVQEARAKSGDLKILELAAHYAHGKPKEHTQVTGDVTIRVTFDRDAD